MLSLSAVQSQHNHKQNENMTTQKQTINTTMKTTQYELDKRRADLRDFILSCREHAARSTGEIREANLSHMNAAIKSLQELNRKN
jgi:L-lactate utilization protein LutB